MTQSRALARAFLWGARVLLRMGRLEKIDLLPLRGTLDEAMRLYGPTPSTTADDVVEEAAQYEFQVSPWHAVKVLVWRGEVHRVTYYLTDPSPERDAKAMLSFYGQGNQWKTMEDGYTYERVDGDRLVHLSALPILSVETKSFAEERWRARER